MYKELEGVTIKKITKGWLHPGVVILDSNGKIHRLLEQEVEEDTITKYSDSPELHPCEEFHLGLITEEECISKIRELNKITAKLNLEYYRRSFPELFENSSEG